MKIVIIGGVAGGASAAARLRRLDEEIEIVMFEKSPYISYANCGLPYYIGGVITDRKELIVQTPDQFEKRFNVRVKINHEVIEIDRYHRHVLVKNVLTNEVHREDYDKLILAPGAKPLIPQLPGIDSPLIFTLRNVPDTFKITEFIEHEHPKRALIVGAGYIGLEMAENLMHRGLEVTIVEMMSHVIASLDEDMAFDVHHYIRQKGARLLLNHAVSAFETTGKVITATIGTATFDFDMVIMSVGVLPDTKLAQEAGLIVNARNALVVNDYLQTNDPDIYAVGDAILVKQFTTRQEAYIPLAGPANRQGRLVADNVLGANKKYHGSQGTAVLKFFDLVVATTGLGEISARKSGYVIDKVFELGKSHASYYPGATPLMLKLIFERGTGMLLGAQAVGFEGVDKRIDVLATAMRARMNARDLIDIDLAYAPPIGSSKDAVNMIGYLAENVLDGVVKQYYVEEIPNLPQDDSVIYLDVRDKDVFETGHFDGSVNIPLSELRNRISELQQGKKVYIVCDGGMRSYLAARTLKQNGFDAYSLAGGFRLFKEIERDRQEISKLDALCGKKN
ncbi:MAG TPA: CoA-disulfide reductase [Bacilli bacterium]|nr:CoA-disulfide reductase [Bacilli bacterium]